MMGGSYRATVQWLAAREGAPLTCLFPQAPAARYFDEIPYTGGAFRMEWALGWINGTSGRIGQNENAMLTDRDAVHAHRPLISMDSVMGRVMPLYRDFLQHSTEDAYWDRILFDDADFADMDVPALTVTGWYDADQPGAFHYWRGMRAHSPAADRQYLLAGPWDHGETRTGGTPRIGELDRPGSVMDIDGLAMEWFDWCLKGDGDGEFDLPRARVYLTGANQWMDFDEYPPRRGGRSQPLPAQRRERQQRDRRRDPVMGRPRGGASRPLHLRPASPGAVRACRRRCRPAGRAAP